MEDKAMSFNLNPLNNNTPQIRTSKSQDGGAGNLGYFQQNKKDEQQDKEKSVFFEEPKDTLTLSDAKEFSYVEPPFLLKVVEYIKMIFRRLLHQ